MIKFTEMLYLLPSSPMKAISGLIPHRGSARVTDSILPLIDFTSVVLRALCVVTTPYPLSLPSKAYQSEQPKG